jgi:hypothetical protein
LGDADKDRFILHQGFIRQVRICIRGDLGAAVIAIFGCNFIEILADQPQDLFGVSQQVFQEGSALPPLAVLVFDLLSFHGIQTP